MSSMDKPLQNITDLQTQIDDLANKSKLEEQDYIELCETMKSLFQSVNSIKISSECDEKLREENKELQKKLRKINTCVNIDCLTEKRCQHIIKKGIHKGMKCLRPCDKEKNKCISHLK